MSRLTIDEATAPFHSQKRLAERAMEQLDDETLHAALDANTNSIAVIVKHMAGNRASRWTDLLTSDGAKPWRDRDGEFIDTFTSRAEMMQAWEAGWARVFETLGSLAADDNLAKQVRTRGEPGTVAWAIMRQISHYGYHVGQIVLIARVLAKDDWRVLTIPRGGSKEFNDRMSRGAAQ